MAEQRLRHAPEFEAFRYEGEYRNSESFQDEDSEPSNELDRDPRRYMTKIGSLGRTPHRLWFLVHMVLDDKGQGLVKQTMTTAHPSTIMEAPTTGERGRVGQQTMGDGTPTRTLEVKEAHRGRGFV
ncbi:hypothetical protein ACEPPN_008062 [Leptodophora sp. 'Broadleaf-Isolate-01']